MPSMNPKRLGGIVVSVVALAAFVISLFLLNFLFFGPGSPRLVAVGIVSTTLFVFLFTLIVFYWIWGGDVLLQMNSIRTAIAISFTVAYLLVVSFSLVAGDLGLTLDNGVLNNFHLVYISIIGFYFGSTTAETVAKIAKNQPGGNPPP